MQHSRGGGRNDSGHAQSDQSTIKADDKAVIGVDAGHECHSDLT